MKKHNIVDTFPDIDPNKITITSGSSLDQNTGIVSGDVSGTPITYSYDCGTNAGGGITLNITLNFKGRSSIIINDDLNKVYDGTVIVNPTNITKKGSDGVVSFEWYKKGETTTKAIAWMKLPTVSSEVGEYKVVVIIGGDGNYIKTTVEQELSILENKIEVPTPGAGGDLTTLMEQQGQV